MGINTIAIHQITIKYVFIIFSLLPNFFIYYLSDNQDLWSTYTHTYTIYCLFSFCLLLNCLTEATLFVTVSCP